MIQTFVGNTLHGVIEDLLTNEEDVGRRCLMMLEKCICKILLKLLLVVVVLSKSSCLSLLLFVLAELSYACTWSAHCLWNEL